jgi:hypothetical protein
MTYSVTKTDGTVVATVQDTKVDTTTDLTLLGKNYRGYGTFVAENFIHLLENFSYTSAPPKPIKGQIYYNTTERRLYVYNDATVGWRALAKVETTASTPSNVLVGEMWWDTVNKQLKVYDGSAFVTVGPATPTGFGTSGQVVENVQDIGYTDYAVVKDYVDGTVVAILSPHAEFTPIDSTLVTNFTKIYPGVNLNKTIASGAAKYTGTSTNSDKLNNLNSTDFLRANTAASTSGSVSFLTDTGIRVGAGADLAVTISGGVDVNFKNQSTDADINFIVTTMSGANTAMNIDGATALATVAGNPVTGLGIATKNYVDAAVGSGNALLRDGSISLIGNLVPDSSNTRNLGSIGARYKDIYGITLYGNLTATGTSSTGNLTINSSTASTSYLTGALTVSGGVGVTGNVYVNGQINGVAATPSTSTSTGSMVITGGAGFSGNINAGGTITGATIAGTSAGIFGSGNVAQTGEIRLPNAGLIAWRNSPNTFDSGNITYNSGLYLVVSSANGANINVAGSTVANFVSTGLSVGNLVSSGNVQIGGTIAANAGVLQVTGHSSFSSILEKATIDNTTTLNATTANLDVLTSTVIYYTLNAGGTFNFNIRGSSTQSLNNLMTVGQAVTLAVLTTQGTTGYYPTALTIDGISVSPKWQNASTPILGNPNSIDVYTYTVIKTASATWTVLATQTQFKS